MVFNICIESWLFAHPEVVSGEFVVGFDVIQAAYSNTEDNQQEQSYQ